MEACESGSMFQVHKPFIFSYKEWFQDLIQWEGYKTGP